MDVTEAIRKRRAVRTYTDKPVPDEVLDPLLRLALRAPTGSGAQAWSMMVVRDAKRRRQVADLVIDGGATYFSIMRPKKDGVTDEEHAQWGRDYAEQILATYRIAPVWLIGLLVPRNNYPERMQAGGYLDDVISVSFAFENLMLAARSEGLGTVPTTAFQRFEKDRLREILGLRPMSTRPSSRRSATHKRGPKASHPRSSATSSRGSPSSTTRSGAKRGRSHRRARLGAGSAWMTGGPRRGHRMTQSGTNSATPPSRVWTYAVSIATQRSARVSMETMASWTNTASNCRPSRCARTRD